MTRRKDVSAPARRLALLGALSACALALLAGSATAAIGPRLTIDSRANTTVAPGATFTYFLTVENVGDELTNGSPLSIVATLPSGLEAISASGALGSGWDCPATSFHAQLVACERTGVLERETSLSITAKASTGASGALTATFALSGGGAPALTTATPIRIGADPLPFGIAAFDQQVNDPANAPFTQAAGHPYEVSTEIDFNSADARDPDGGATAPVEPPRDVFVELPPGFIGNPAAAPYCSMAQLAVTSLISYAQCPAASQVGVTKVFASDGKYEDEPIFNMVPPAGVPARFAFAVLGTVITLDAAVRSGGDYGLSIASRQISEGIAVAGTRTTFWGVPADPGHDAERYDGTPYVRPALTSFLRNPTACTKAKEGLTTSLHTDSWYAPGALGSDRAPNLSDPAWKSASTVSHEAPGYPYPPEQWGEALGTDGCAQVPFEPSIKVAPTTNQADSPTGLTVDLSIPQNGLSEPDAITQSDLEGAVVKLPTGMAINPSQANGLGGCSAAQIDLHGENTQPTCPNSSKIGTVSIKTPLLDHPIDGSVYLAAQGDNPFNSLLALYLVADDKVQTGTVIKLAGKVNLNPGTGQLETVFTNQPQLPFEALHLELFGGAHSALITPPHCGTYATEATLSPWSGNPASELRSTFTLSSGPGGGACPPKPAGFAPKLSAGTRNPTAGAFSPFSLRLTREDGTQRFASLKATLPPGLLGKLAGVPYCPESALAGISAAQSTGAAQLANPSCPAASQVGSVTVGAGAGPDPFFVQSGRAYLAGPYNGAPLSLVVVTPALAGPFDLGTVVVRNALRVDPASAQITAVSDPLPQIVHGIPLDLRDLRVNVDRPAFTLNPTSCDPMAIEGTLAGSEGANAAVSARFQVGECARLGFKPRLRIKLKGATGRSGHPALRAELKARPGDANIARTSVALPHSEFLAQSHIRTICTRVQFAAGAGNGAGCPKGSIYGHARAITPLLDRPLEGPVYLRSSSHPLPDLVAALHGQIEVELVGRIDTDRAGGIRTTFAAVPDAPVSKFVLTMPAGRKSLLENSRNLCKSTSRATVLMDGQNGKVADQRPLVRNSCKQAKRKHKKHPKHGR